MEPSEGCTNDWLEIRDGAHGYSRLIGTYCGKTFPEDIYSRGSNLYLRFVSDQNIEYSGFKAQYESIRNKGNELEAENFRLTYIVKRSNQMRLKRS